MTVAEAADTLLKVADRDKIIKLLADIEKATAAHGSSTGLQKGIKGVSSILSQVGVEKHGI